MMSDYYLSYEMVSVFYRGTIFF